MQPASSDTRLREAPLRTQSVPPTKPRAFSQTSVTDVMAHNMALAFGTSCFAGLNSLSMPQPSCAPQVEQAAPSAPLAAPRLETEEQLLEVEIEKILKKEEIKMEETENEAEHLQEYNPTETVAQARPYRDPILIAQSLEEAWKSVYNEQLKTSFSMGTSVKDILCSEWYRDQLTLKLQNCDDLPLALKGTRPRRTGRKKKETSIPELIATYMANPPPSRPTQKKTHQRHLLPVKVQKQTISQEVPSQSHQSQRQPQNRLQNHPQHDPQHQLQNQSQNQTQHHLQQLPQHPLQHQIQHHSQQHPQQHSQHHSLHYPQQQPQNHSQNHVQHHNDFYNQTSNLSNNIPPQHEPVQTQQQTIIGQDYIEVPQSHQGQGTSQFSLMSQPETRTAVYTQPTAIDPRMNLSLGDFIAQSSNLTLQLQQEELLKATSAAAMILQPSISQQPTNNNRGNSLLTPDLSSAQLTPTGNRSGTPNILRKFRGNEGCSSPAYSEKGLLHSSTSSPSKIHLTNNLEAVESAQSYLQPQTTPETPRRRERKQKLVSDHHYQSSQLYSLLQDDQKPEEKKKEPGRELTYFMNMDSQPETSNETGSIMWGEAEIKIEIPEEKYTPPQKKRGRPRKDRVANVPQQPRKTKGPYKPRQPKQPKQQKVAHQPQSIPEKKTGQNDYETAEMERKALLQALPSNLQDAIKAQKVMDKEEKKTPRKYVKKPKQPSVEEEEDAVNSVAASLQFLQSIANMNSAMLFAGLNPALLTDSPLTPLSPPIVPVPQIAQQIYPEAIQHSPQYFNQQLVNKVVPHVVPQFKAPAKPKAAPKKENIAKDQLILPPPTATAVATSGTPLIINFYEKTPQIEAAHVWTDDTRQEINSAEFIEQEKTSPPVYKPKIITKAALKYIPEPIRAENETEYGQQGDGTDQLNPPPPWMSAKNAERRKAPLLNRNIPKVTKPVVMKPVKTVATTLKQKLTSRQLILMMNNFAQQLKEFEFSMFTSKHRSTELVSMEESEVSRIINGKFDQLVQTCVSAVFEEDGPSHLITHSKEQPAFRLKINWKSRDSEPRWLLWHETHVTNCVKHVKKAMVKQKMAEVDKMTTRIERQVDKIKNPRAKHTVDLLSQQIEQIHGNLLSKLNSFKESFRIPIGKAFKHKLKAIEDRLARWISIKNKYRQTKVENFTLAWKAATDNYTAAVDSADKEVKMLIMLRSYQNLTDALEMNDALVDVCMIASRLQVLYFHAFGVFKQMVDVVESRIVVQCLEDTEQFLVLAESKVKLLEDKAEIDKLNMINLYMQADKMNVERGDDLIGDGNMVWGRPTSEIPLSDGNKIYKNFTHMETKLNTAADQFFIITQLTIP
uniref:Myb-like domain-containing protein n=1 Tax=Caenorhabditis tropicalis TaxID=1561998 RepID=A0A1I7U7G5_9PELO